MRTNHVERIGAAIVSGTACTLGVALIVGAAISGAGSGAVLLGTLAGALWLATGVFYSGAVHVGTPSLRRVDQVGEASPRMTDCVAEDADRVADEAVVSVATTRYRPMFLHQPTKSNGSLSRHRRTKVFH